jgi:tetratricopeptide (TPR) repeat protein
MVPAFAEETQNTPFKTFDDFQWDASQIGPAVPGASAVGEVIPMERLIAEFKKRVEESPKHSTHWYLLGQLYMRHAKESDDWASYERALEAFQQLQALEPESVNAKLRTAEAFNAMHEFTKGAELASIVLQRQPGSVPALAILSDCQVELGDYDAAKTTLDQLLELNDSPPIQARMARWEELHGEHKKAIQRFQLATKSLDDLGADSKESVWYLWRQGCLHFECSEFDQANQLFMQALSLDSQDVAVLMSLAELKHAQSNFPEAEKFAKQVVDLSDAPPAMALVGDILSASGKTGEAESWWSKAEKAMRLEQETAGKAHAREFAMFLADHDRHLDEAVKLATADLKQRHDIFAYDSLAWCQFKNGQVEEARENMKRALAFGTQSRLLHQHAAAILP